MRSWLCFVFTEWLERGNEDVVHKQEAGKEISGR